MPRLGTLLLATALLATPFLGSAAQAGSTKPSGAPSWKETVIDADQSFRGLDAVDRRTAWVTGGSATEGGPGRVFRTTDGGRDLGGREPARHRGPAVPRRRGAQRQRRP